MLSKEAEDRVGELFQSFSDPYLKKREGQGIFLSGIALGMLALEQVRGEGEADKEGGRKNGPLHGAPLFKQINFGSLGMRDLKKLLSRVPLLTAHYCGDERGGMIFIINGLVGLAQDYLFAAEERECGVEGNFAFSGAFLNAPGYCWRIFPSKKGNESEEVSQNRDSISSSSGGA